MPDVTAKLISRRDLEFLLYEWLDVERLCARPRFADHSRETFDSVLSSAERIAVERFLPHRRTSDLEEPVIDGERVRLLPEIKSALAAFADAGLLAATCDYELGGMQLPVVVEKAGFAYFKGANVGTSSYPFLTIGNANLLLTHGTPAQVETFVKPEMEGRFFGTMCLSEPQAGSSLSDITTRAEYEGESPLGAQYRLRGNKMWISAGEHELSDNIVHLVLAKIPGPDGKLIPGVKGISLFIVPKFLVGDDGSLGKRNDVLLAGLFHKMGWRGTTSTALNFGDNGECVGYLVGKPHAGLSYMFQMMNEARIGVGMGAVMLGYAGYLYSLDYARQRPQGRLPDGKDPSSPQIAIVEHADVRRMLLTQKAYVEGAFDLGLYAARLFDDTQTLPTAEERQTALELLDLLTPIVKSWPSEFCLKANELAIQILGGHGYTREYPVEQYYRDNRLNPIHEGTHGIQSLDLLGRKVSMNGGAALKQLVKLIQDCCQRAGEYPALSALRQPLEQVLARLSTVTLALLGDLLAGQVNQGLANSALYLKAFGHTVIGWRWLEQAIRAEEGLARGNPADADFYQGKLQAARYFLTWEVPGCHHELALLEARDDCCLTMQDSWF